MELPFIKYSLRGRLLVLAGATFLLCVCVILLFFPLLNITLDGLLDRSMRSMEEEKEMEATTITRLMVLEFSRLKELLRVSPGSEREVDQTIKNLLWEKVTFNSIIEGIELIQAAADPQDRHVTYLFYRRDAPELKPMDGPQKLLKKFSGQENELINIVNQQQWVDKNLLESVNRGPKKEGEMLLRYMPVHVLLPDLGAIYWGVAKIGISTEGMRRLLFLQSQEQDQLRRAIWLEIVLSLTISGLLALSLLYLWVRSLTEPLQNLSDTAAALKEASPQDFDLWLENLKRVDPKGQAEVATVRQVLWRLGSAIPQIGQKLLELAGQAVWGRVAARVLPLFQAQITAGRARENPQEVAALVEELNRALKDLQSFRPAPPGEWQEVILTPVLESAWRLLTWGLPPQVRLSQELQDLPPVWGSPSELKQALFLLLNFAVEQLPPEGELSLQTKILADAAVELVIRISGPGPSPEDCRQLLHPFQDPGRVPTDLGPALAAAIASRHQGRLKIHPGESGGMVLSLELPTITESHASRQPFI
ncbi:MAG: ATP-binding protein [Thermodesulfobacteriota bacterium]